MALVFAGSNPAVHPTLRLPAARGPLAPAAAFIRSRGILMGMRRRWLGLLALAALALTACNNSDDAERLAAQRFFRTYLLLPDDTAVADVRIQGLVDALPPDFPVADGLTLLGSAFTDSARTRVLIVSWESGRDADDLYAFYGQALDQDPWSITQDPRFAGVDFLTFTDTDNPAFTGELRIAQEGSTAVVLLVVRETLESPGS